MLNTIVSKFFPNKSIEEIKEHGGGHINDTYKVSFEGETDHYILQRINVQVFTNPEGLVQNHTKIQEFLSDKSSDIEIPSLCKTATEGYLYTDADGKVWRMMNFIKDSYSIDLVEKTGQAFEAGKGYGWFANACSSLDATEFVEAIKDFHRLSFRVGQLNDAIKNDAAGRLESIQELVDFYKAREEKLMTIERMVDANEIPQRVVHNDTKINNLLFRGDKACAVIDLDTVGPGILFYDFGDALRTNSNTAAEDEKDLSKVDFNTVAFKEFAEGYLEQVKPILTEKEKANFYLAPVLMTYIMGIRFLADYLNGDVYYKVNSPTHNLERSLVQRRLIERIEANENTMINIIKDTLA